MKYKILGLAIVALLATVSVSSTVSACWVYETAWGGIQDFEGSSTARYMRYRFDCSDGNIQRRPLLIGKPGHFTRIGVVRIESHCEGGDRWISVCFVIRDHDYYLVKSHLHVNEGGDDIPVNKGGNPQVGRFEYSRRARRDWRQCYHVDLPDGVLPILEIAAHCEVKTIMY
jgi:hypothetical protein